jgi:rhodanese-related sulfurtransferase
MTVASTGASEKGLVRAGIDGFAKVYLHPGHHASYYPGARPIHLKLLFGVQDGRILGAQGVGAEGVEKRIDVIAMAIQLGGTVDDLAAAELCYAPQYGAAKDPVNLAGMIAQNVLVGDMPLADWTALGRTDALVVDVRDPDEFAKGHLPGSINLPLPHMRERWTELPSDREIWVTCGVGQRAYYATRFLAQQGVRVRNLSASSGTVARPAEGPTRKGLARPLASIRSAMSAWASAAPAALRRGLARGWHRTITRCRRRRRAARPLPGSSVLRAGAA